MAVKKSASLRPEWWHLGQVLFMVKDFLSDSSAKMRLFENLGKWVDFFNGANKMHPSRRYSL